MTPRHGAAGALVAVTMALLLMWGAGSGAPLIQAPTATLDADEGATDVADETAAPPPGADGGVPQDDQSGSETDWTLWLQLAMVAVILYAALRWFRSRGTARAVEFEQREPIDELAELLDALTPPSPQDSALAGEPRNAVVACWVSLEEGVARAGIAPGVSETSADLTRRVLQRFDIDATGNAATTQLAHLYREARFSRHPITAEHRDEAVTALADIHRSLQTASRRHTSEPR